MKNSKIESIHYKSNYSALRYGKRNVCTTLQNNAHDCYSFARIQQNLFYNVINLYIVQLGKRTTNVEPLPSSLSSQISPPCASTVNLQYVNPKPVETLCPS